MQGCTLGCPGCFNPQTHASRGGESVEVIDLVQRIRALGKTIDGITVSGGEPLQQIDATCELLLGVRRDTELSAILFTGFTWAEVLRSPRAADILLHIDVLLAGRYDARQRLARGLRGSANKTVHFLTNRYSDVDLNAVPDAEVMIDTTGVATISGINPLNVNIGI